MSIMMRMMINRKIFGKSGPWPAADEHVPVRDEWTPGGPVVQRYLVMSSARVGHVRCIDSWVGC